MDKILVTGGAGYIGSQICKLLKKDKNEILIFDNLSTGKKKYTKYGNFIYGDLRNKKDIYKIFKKNKISSVIHLAASCLVGESQKKIDEYYENNVVGTINLLDCIVKFKVKNLIFSSTCSVYGSKNKKIRENEILNPINVYGETKKICEEMIKTYSAAYKFNYIILRYFNAAGADLDMSLGEDRNNETHLIPLIFKSIKNKKLVKIYGKNYNTVDKTCVRDFIHVLDIAEAHIKSLSFLKLKKKSHIFNLGTGKGISVLNIIKTTSKVISKKIEYKYFDRRKGDPDYLVANSRKIEKVLNFKNKYSKPKIIIKSAWNWFNSIN
jgi:UDP-glucose 4-epimerase